MKMCNCGSVTFLRCIRWFKSVPAGMASRPGSGSSSETSLPRMSDWACSASLTSCFSSFRLRTSSEVSCAALVARLIRRLTSRTFAAIRLRVRSAFSPSRTLSISLSSRTSRRMGSRVASAEGIAYLTPPMEKNRLRKSFAQAGRPQYDLYHRYYQNNSNDTPRSKRETHVVLQTRKTKNPKYHGRFVSVVVDQVLHLLPYLFPSFPLISL